MRFSGREFIYDSQLGTSCRRMARATIGPTAQITLHGTENTSNAVVAMTPTVAAGQQAGLELYG